MPANACVATSSVAGLGSEKTAMPAAFAACMSIWSSPVVVVTITFNNGAAAITLASIRQKLTISPSKSAKCVSKPSPS